MINPFLLLLKIFRAGCLFTLLLSAAEALSQSSPAAIPPSVRFGLVLPESVMQLASPDVEAIHKVDRSIEKEGSPFRVAVMIPVDVDLSKSGRWTVVPGQGRLWHLTVVAEGAKALAPYYDSFFIPAGGELFVYHDRFSGIQDVHKQPNATHNQHYASGFILGSSLTFEYFEPFGVKELAKIHLSDIAFFYRRLVERSPSGSRDFGDSGDCEVNILCDEGKSWQDEKKGVVRILSRVGSSLFWCNGSLINNAREDFEPYVLTADHCAFWEGEYATPANLQQWVFYLNYESAACDDPLIEPSFDKMTGATQIAHGGDAGDSGSDFYLVRLNSMVPASFDPFFLGWDRQNAASGEGVCIHHPQGDIKKISTYDQPVASTQWSGNGVQSHWRVFWTVTLNGHGVTEPGSSGSPLFSQHGLIVGTLTGGESSCGNTGGADYFGKFSYHWKSNGNDASSQLEPWLDPDHKGLTVLGGTYYSNIVVAAFSADTTVIPVKSAVDFADLSSGKPEQWEWYFEGGSPSASTLQNPEAIEYKSYGTYDVRLISSNEVNSDTLLVEDYIKVEPVISRDPNEPSVFRLFFGEAANSPDQIDVFDVLGNRVPFRIAEVTSSTVSIDLQGLTSGVYLVTLHSEAYAFTGKLLLIK